MHVFLTGGTGLVGSHVADCLRRRGDEVSALVRPGADVSLLERIGCRVVRGDVGASSSDLASAMTGADTVVHAAALVYARESWTRVHAVNVEGTARVLEAAARAGARTAVHVSSVAVYGPVDGVVSEDTPTDTPLAPTDLYARSKREAETAARRAADRGGLELTLLRPSAVYGERDRLFAPKVARLAGMPIVPIVGSGDNTIPVVYAGNVAAAVAACLDRPPGSSAPRIFDLGLDLPLTQAGLVIGLGRALGIEPRIVHVPGGLLRTAAGIAERLGLGIPGTGDLSLSRFTRLTLGENPYTSRRIREELGWAPPFRHEEGFARTAAWLRASRGARAA